MRGTRTPASRESVQNGIIPAYAGNTSLSGNLEDFGGDHPRVCGEHVRNDRAIEARAGSSPRMRGTRIMVQDLSMYAGIIPAYAGNTTNDYDFDTPRRDHPRVCGEHQGGLSLLLRHGGSSPRMRGTPACRLVPERKRWDHPRVCGEHFDVCDFIHVITGIIPAYAGNTGKPPMYGRYARDHPRVCGEHGQRYEHRYRQWGSSPRMRGTRFAMAGRENMSGIIPAYAGNT